MPLAIRLPFNEAVSSVGSYPTHLIVGDRKQTAVQRALRRGGLAGYEPASIATLLALCALTSKKNFVFYDVGAHIGIYSLLVAAIFRSFDPVVISFEPTPSTLDILRSITKANDLSVISVDVALSDSIGKVNLYLSPKAETSNSLDKTFRESNDAIVVQMTTLDAFVAASGVPPTIVKIDVETHEPQVISGAMKTIARFSPYIICEILPRVSHRMVECLDALKEFGYHFYKISPESTWVASTPEMILAEADSMERNWLFTPEEPSGMFFRLLERWLLDVGKCTEETNVLYAGGQPIPRSLLL